MCICGKEGGREEERERAKRIHIFVLLPICVSILPLLISCILANRHKKNEILTMNASPWHHQASGSRPTFTFCGSFSGSGEISAARWLKKLEWELEPHHSPGPPSPKTLLKYVELLLTDDAATWAETSQEVSSLLSMKNPSVVDLVRFKNLFEAKFPRKSFGLASTHATFDHELRQLSQTKDESLNDYYHRVLAMMHRVGATDRISDGRPLTILESTMLDLIIRAFVDGLYDPIAYKGCSEKVKQPGLSLHEIYRVAEATNSSIWPEPQEEKERWQCYNDNYPKQVNRSSDVTPSSGTWPFENTPTSTTGTHHPLAQWLPQPHREPKQDFSGERYGGSREPKNSDINW